MEAVVISGPTILIVRLCSAFGALVVVASTAPIPPSSTLRVRLLSDAVPVEAVADLVPSLSPVRLSFAVVAVTELKQAVDNNGTNSATISTGTAPQTKRSRDVEAGVPEQQGRLSLASSTVVAGALDASIPFVRGYIWLSLDDWILRRAGRP